MIILFLAGIGLAELTTLVIFIVIAIGLILAARAFFLWYWKVNVIIQNQEQQLRLLSEIVQTLRLSRDKDSN